MDPITFRNQPIPGIEVASMRPSKDQAITPPGEHTNPGEQVASTHFSATPHDGAAEDSRGFGERDPQQAKFLVPSHGRACPAGWHSPARRHDSRAKVHLCIAEAAWEIEGLWDVPLVASLRRLVTEPFQDLPAE